ncbi:LIC_11485 family protein [Leptospira kirschneri]|uniref:Uncharacterized protein n=1 Tax=Leptospira kirschneri str. 200802841 TaxID=1193047 RepID=A0A828Y2V6_9LEPT|nr:hypothetical protein [Leptospira kirschneri]EJO70602.1 hypothetical protein LEP1GSC044_1992 [Leptospira kirschneri serovar Grippotyphosa str. RM52]EKO51215.1 hypothetical protein LEP1GSC131_2922 [Leptospira kirschneri str. 200802841]EKP05173.1 hypothetical protein LEP1GSC018_2757 [Leptospira kirschneri str. 2008720114]EKQ82258.1 hypothetical protein LEP1GSC064_3990 [Leptospira kirschneri serovar Grippotyphosa str. Moskva]EKR07117.1 hypothetical protein LEP1GSC122_3516 [Leptospira kirschneri
MDFNVKDKFQSGFSSIDNLSRNLPPQVQKTLLYTAISLAMLGIALAVLIGIQRGKEGAAFDDQAKELDRKALFLEDLERDYNRRRRSIRYSDPDLSFTRESSSNLEIDRYEREKPKDGLLPESNIPEGKDPLRDGRREGVGTPKLPTESDVLPTQDREKVTNTNRNLDDPGTISSERGSSNNQDRPTLMKPPKSNSKDTFEPR